MGTPDLPPHLRFDRPFVERYLRNYPLAKLVKAVLHDADRLIDGPCLLVGNHGPLAIDTGMLLHAIFRDTGRVVRGLGDRLLFNNALGRQMARSVGSVEGTPDNAHALLAHGDAVLVYPGGARETNRGPKERYTLRWEGRYGFAKLALRAQVPVIPVACVGADDLFTQLVDSETMQRSFAGQLAARFLKPEAIPPLYLPKRLYGTQFHYFFGAPIAPTPYDVESPTEAEAAVRAHQLRVKESLEALLARGLEVRREKLGRKLPGEQHAAE